MANSTQPIARLIVMTRYPRPGHVKTRLIDALGQAGAAGLHRRMAEWTIRRALQYCHPCPGVDLQVAYCGAERSEMQAWLGDSIPLAAQQGANLGRRMQNCLADALAAGCDRALLVGTDCPAIDEKIYNRALAALAQADVVLGPARDGGYYLVGLSREADIFDGISFGRDDVLSASLDRCDSLGLQAVCIDQLPDIDRPEDLASLPAGFLSS